MFAALDHVHNAVDLLVGQTVSLDERFCEAAAEFIAAVSRADDWPASLAEKARAIQRRLTEGGSVEVTVRDLDAATAEQIADEILDFAERLATFRVDRVDPGPAEDEFLDLPANTYHFRRPKKATKRWRGRATRYCRC